MQEVHFIDILLSENWLLEWVKENLESVIVKVGINLIMYKTYFKGHVTKMTVPWLMQLVTILSRQSTGFTC
jgi:hypothetical protein